MEVIGLLGYQGVGKNYIAENILNEILPKENTLIMAFADHFKIDCINKHNVEFNKIYLNKDIESRKLLQRVGTEEGRDVYGDDIWVNVLESWMRVYNNRGIKRFIICDVRFQNEVNWIKKIGGIVIKINANDRRRTKLLEETSNNEEKVKEICDHRTESELENVKGYDYEVNNSVGKNIKEELVTVFNI